MIAAVQRLFAAYERLTNAGLAGDPDAEALAACYAEEFIGAAPTGVRTGTNDTEYLEVLAQGLAQYRAIGTKRMTVKTVAVTTIDELHCIATVSWSAVYDRGESPDVTIDFDVNYLVQLRGENAVVFGWITGDEQAALQAHGII
ncbi:MAG TPA: nuclear transport factor 2 family protein [Gordonia sp. (in: high G+C Gram-positive bacteria)]|uniref:nuclear transport factor 2 family protein n=1 Tax=unclassified Gordonia (in: high G+C Gram-positive bacteria) TaxID=2657482 RepID=UPI000F940327|nr:MULTISPECIES: nuclear transport factor 2 family protein [unclassified Gordonia (in: high G+C Gram-positive bacteria)]RUP40887.1 MAG: nuclear transport factor 2 family protein [Gordonia sp. (in: high G+C Gram-positive bacteria)]HNP57709.1 nuclear transport factor 2 family protein [Gordonia sp. (in: high G+C Gram-positive bacteria)]HRC51312.1 nuclear transport factor 2 family protein [Gordonia sp. (in: high G+C Gram-positive bacteria)]